jgi:hypothetical protein
VFCCLGKRRARHASHSPIHHLSISPYIPICLGTLEEDHDQELPFSSSSIEATLHPCCCYDYKPERMSTPSHSIMSNGDKNASIDKDETSRDDGVVRDDDPFLSLANTNQSLITNFTTNVCIPLCQSSLHNRCANG